jgi:hypothetical protein
MTTSWYKKIESRHIVSLLLLLSIAISMQCYFAHGSNGYTRYNNYVIFKNSFIHLLHNQNLYVLYSNEVYDLYKYSPTFAFLMAPFYYLPDVVGLTLFNVLNVGVFLYALSKLKIAPDRYKWMLLFMVIEIGISLTSTQTNLLMAGLLILGFSNLETDNPFLAALCIALTVYIKIFGIVAFVLWIIYPNKARFLLYSIFWLIVLAALPLLVVGKDSLIHQYHNWQILLQEDHSASYGASFIGWLHSWFKWDISKGGTVIVAAIIFCLPFVKISDYKVYLFRLQILASILIWIVIFNHRAESPTYSIALAGVGIWYFTQKPLTAYRVLLICCLLFTSFSSTDMITPGWITDRYVEPYAIKAVFCIIIWVVLIRDLISGGVLKRNRKITSPGYIRA